MKRLISDDVMMAATKSELEGNKKYPTQKAALVHRKTPLVYVPSKQRCWKKSVGTIQLLNDDEIPGVVVVEPSEAEEYQAWLKNSSLSVHVLEKDGQGVSYARNEILKIASNTDWFWIIDDDVSGFYESTKEGAQLIDMKSTLRFATEHEKITSDPQIAVIGLEYKMFSSGLAKRYAGHFITNSYCNVCCAYNKSRMPKDIQFNFRVREDYDFALQIISHNLKTIRFAWLSFSCPAMGTTRGGMFDYYSVNKRACMAQRAVFAKKWAKVCKPIMKSNRADVKIRWQMLDRLMPRQIAYSKNLEKEAKKKRKRFSK
eukprot:TRINITY_DN37940_c0_g1_i1.p1 TRINITY_DN37940_c0_g1~~TRINITY_DN37940_c0_g1_i1.p1  ORF type:complete len:332 (+),score=64.44 TRINITY_DN37940_c0_g1_i1:52-996(+)